MDAHHAIVPTEKTANLSSLSQRERQLYLHIARQYLAQFYPAYCYSETTVQVTIEGGLFNTKARQDKSLGWKQLFARQEPNGSKASGNKSTEESTGKDDEENDEFIGQLPPLKLGQALHCTRGELLEKNTQPPGLTICTQALTTEAGSGTCSNISMQVTTSNWATCSAARASALISRY